MLAKLEKRIESETYWLGRSIAARRKRNEGRKRRLLEMRAQRAGWIGAAGGVKLGAATEDSRSRLIIEAEHISKALTLERTIVKDFSTRIMRGDRIGIIGRNGAGKTTLIRLLTGELEPDSGKVKIAKTVHPAYFDQRRASLDPTKTLWQTLAPEGGDHVMVRGKPRHVVAYLRDFLFDEKLAKSLVGGLSGGERNRLMLARILAQPSNLLVLDEPTNDLDMDTLDLLQEVLDEYEGTLLIVSHDRDFLDRLVNGTLVMPGDGSVREYAGGYSDYLRQSADERAEPARSATKSATRPAEAKTPRARLSYKENRELETLPGEMAKLTKERDALEAKLADGSFYERDRAGFETATRRIGEVRDALAAAEERWLELEMRREELAAGRSQRTSHCFESGRFAGPPRERVGGGSSGGRWGWRRRGVTMPPGGGDLRRCHESCSQVRDRTARAPDKSSGYLPGMSLLDLFLTVVLLLIWGINFAISKAGLELLPPLLFVTLRFTIAAVLLVPFARVPRGQLGMILVLATIFAAHFALMYFAMRDVDAGIAAIARPGAGAVLVDHVGDRVQGSYRLAARAGAGHRLRRHLRAVRGAAAVGRAAARVPHPRRGVPVGERQYPDQAHEQFRRLRAQRLCRAVHRAGAADRLAGPGTRAGGGHAKCRLGWVGRRCVRRDPGGGGELYHLVPAAAALPGQLIMPITLLVPVLGVLFGVLLRGEPLTWPIISGGVITLAGLASSFCAGRKRRPPRRRRNRCERGQVRSCPDWSLPARRTCR